MKVKVWSLTSGVLIHCLSMFLTFPQKDTRTVSGWGGVTKGGARVVIQERLGLTVPLFEYVFRCSFRGGGG